MNTYLLTRQVTIRDLATHSVGLSSSNFMRFQRPFTRSMLARYVRHMNCFRLLTETVHELFFFCSKIRFLEATGVYRASTMYNNILYGLLTYITEKIAGGEQTWEELLVDKIFLPLGMVNATFTHEVDHTRDDLAHACKIDGDTGKFREVDIKFQRC